MIRCDVLIVAEIGRSVGWGHVSRSLLLKGIVGAASHVELKIINREPWADENDRLRHSLDEAIETRVLVADGLRIDAELRAHVQYERAISLSYMSDFNERCDLVVAPALNGLPAPANFRTMLDALVCNMPRVVDFDDREPRAKTVGVCMGGGDVDGVEQRIVAALRGNGLDVVEPRAAGGKRSLDDFLRRKLYAQGDEDAFPYYPFGDCSLVVCQGGLSAIELALLGVPTVIRIRSDFAEAYRFMADKGCSVVISEDDPESVARGVSEVLSDRTSLAAMRRACRDLAGTIRRDVWFDLLDIRSQGECESDALSILRRH